MSKAWEIQAIDLHLAGSTSKENNEGGAMNDTVAEKIIRNIPKILVILLVTFAFLYILLPFFIPIALGGILAMAFSPFLKHIKMVKSPRLSILLLTFALFVIGLAPISIVLIRGTKAITNFFSEQSLVVTRHKIEDRVYAVLDNFSEINDVDPVAVREKFAGFVSSAGNYGLNLFSSLLGKIPDIFLLGFITILSFYFFLAHEDYIRKLFDRYFYFSRENGDRFIQVMKLSCKTVFFSNVVTGFVQACIVGLGAFFCKIGDPFIIFIITFFLSFIPVFGAGPFAFFLTLIAFVEGRTGAGIAMAIVATITGLSDNIVRPYLAGSAQVNVHVFITFLSVIGGVLVMGLPGLFVGPLLALLTFGALPIIIEDYLPDQNLNREFDEPKP